MANCSSLSEPEKTKATYDKIEAVLTVVKTSKIQEVRTYDSFTRETPSVHITEMLQKSNLHNVKQAYYLLTDGTSRVEYIITKVHRRLWVL